MSEFQNKDRGSEQGNVLFYILIAVVLLGTLSFAVSQSNRGSVQQLSDEKARLYAAEIIEYSNTISSAVTQLRLRGTKATELCFDDASWTPNYDHAGCTDDLNKIFHVSGGGITLANAPSEAMDTAATPDNLWAIWGNNEIHQVGTTCGTSACTELILIVDELKKDVCVQINTLLGIDNPSGDPPEDSSYTGAYYTGAFTYGSTIGDEALGAPIAGKTAGCFYETDADPEYAYYKVLIAR